MCGTPWTRRQLLGVETVGTFIGRAPRPEREGELALAERDLPAAGRVRRRARREDHHRELRDGGLAPRRLPGQHRLLPRAVGVDVLPRASTSTTTPRTCCGSASTRSTALEPYVDRIPHAQAKDAAARPAARRDRYGFFGKTLSREHPLGRGLVALPGARPRARSTGAGVVDALYEGGFTGVLSRRARGPGLGRHRGEGQAGTGDRPPHAAPADRRLTPAPQGTATRTIATHLDEGLDIVTPQPLERPALHRPRPDAADREGTADAASPASATPPSSRTTRPTDPAGFRELADDLGLTVSGAHAMATCCGSRTPAPVFEAVASRRHRPGDPARRASHEASSPPATASSAPPTCSTAVASRPPSHGLRLGYHNHWWELEPRDRRRTRARSAGRAARPARSSSRSTPTGPRSAAPTSPALLRRLGDRVLALHVKDGPAVKDEPNVAVGERRDAGARGPGRRARRRWRVVEFDACATRHLRGARRRA